MTYTSFKAFGVAATGIAVLLYVHFNEGGVDAFGWIAGSIIIAIALLVGITSSLAHQRSRTHQQ